MVGASGVLKSSACVVYIDDVVVVGATWEEHLRNSNKESTALFKADVRLNTTNCQSGEQQLLTWGM